MSRSARILILALALALLAPAAAQAHKHKHYYVSLGDSYSTGVQADSTGASVTTKHGFANQIPKLAEHRGYKLKLVNFGCGGETTASLLERTEACEGPAIGGPDYAGRTQIAAATRFIRKHRAKVALITVSIGGNDVTACAREADPVSCVAAAVSSIEENVTEIARRLRKAAGRRPIIVGTTYPDVLLGAWVGENPDQQIAQLSVPAFKQFINPTLKQAYAEGKGKFVDVTAKSGAYGPLTEMTTLEPYGTIPVPVAKVCELSYYCQYRNIHATTSGYRLIAKLVVHKLPYSRFVG
jgi:lysophospholipase L1-like esterase